MCNPPERSGPGKHGETGRKGQEKINFLATVSRIPAFLSPMSLQVGQRGGGGVEGTADWRRGEGIDVRAYSKTPRSVPRARFFTVHRPVVRRVGAEGSAHS